MAKVKKAARRLHRADRSASRSAALAKDTPAMRIAALVDAAIGLITTRA